MNRVFRTAAVSGLILLGTAVALEWTCGDVARRLGMESVAFRDAMLAQLSSSPSTPGTLVTWIGDSTLASTNDARAYPYQVADEAPDISSRVVFAPGLNPFAYWALAEPVLQLRPRAVVLVTHLRVWADHARSPADLLDLVPTSELLRAAALPLEARGISRLRLALAPLLAQSTIERIGITLDGLRLGYRSFSPVTIDPATAPVAYGVLAYMNGGVRTIDAYDRPIRERTPEVVMLGATVERFVRAGIPVLVLVTPIPVDVLREQGRYDADLFRARIARIRRVVEQDGGRLLDLHDALGRDEMRDDAGHETQAGHAHIAARVLPVLRDLLTHGTP